VLGSLWGAKNELEVIPTTTTKTVKLKHFYGTALLSLLQLVMAVIFYRGKRLRKKNS